MKIYKIYVYVIEDKKKKIVEIKCEGYLVVGNRFIVIYNNEPFDVDKEDFNFMINIDRVIKIVKLK